MIEKMNLFHLFIQSFIERCLQVDKRPFTCLRRYWMSMRWKSSLAQLRQY